eukprot:Lithocolla_globosa_v1_NODE_4836_length_1355_cov_4.254615.p2 type:complete len:144 gc:universal NODE_4836_length_1355_cov_4.254615:564-133(-)
MTKDHGTKYIPELINKLETLFLGDFKINVCDCLACTILHCEDSIGGKSPVNFWDVQIGVRILEQNTQPFSVEGLTEKVHLFGNVVRDLTGEPIKFKVWKKPFYCPAKNFGGDKINLYETIQAIVLYFDGDLLTRMQSSPMHLC